MRDLYDELYEPRCRRAEFLLKRDDPQMGNDDLLVERSGLRKFIADPDMGQPEIEALPWSLIHRRHGLVRHEQ